MPVVYLIRHAQASFGAADYDQLSERGHIQVKALSRALDRRQLVADRVLTGSLKRQRDTALGCGDAIATALETDAGWDEYDSDDVLLHHSRTDARLERRPDETRPALSSREFQVLLDESLQRWIDAGAAGRARQSWTAFVATVRQALGRATDGLGAGGTALVFTSSGVIAALAASLIGLADRGFVPLNRVSVNTAITKVIVGRRGMTLVSYNEHGHLDEAGGGELLTYR